MKVILIFALLTLSVYTKECTADKPASGYNDCKDLEVEESGNHCCFVDIKTSETESELKFCKEIDKEAYDNLDNAIKEEKAQMEEDGVTVEKFNVDCGKTTNSDDSDSSNYLSQTLIILLSLLF